ncbi:MAG: FkbM family methyltransferase [Candidatus Scalindua sp.]|jgi:FkbM family methyltransferase|nr:FkbM family methyltransferase [Candidatus Scalindua sp.]
MKKIKYYIHLLLNEFLLKPFNLRVSYNIGNDLFEDLKRLFDNENIDCVIDGGAYRGDFSMDITDSFPSVKVYAFEPQKDSFQLLLKNTSKRKSIKPINFALGENSGEATLYKNISAMTNSLSQSSSDALKYFEGYNNPVGQEQVDVIALSDFLNKEGVKEVDVLKLDLQGHELSAIRGLKKQLDCVKSIYIEVEFVSLYEGASLFSEVEIFLREHGFIFFQFYDQVRSPENGRLLYGDAIFLNSKYFSL